METRAAIDSEALLGELGWVRALARRLVGDAEEAEDVAQDALVVALGGARDEPRALRQWLGAIVRNVSRNARRRRARRARAERPLADEPALPSLLVLL
jgi:DNA-directed RNA polymerase specialized sigma24 family protein